MQPISEEMSRAVGANLVWKKDLLARAEPS